MTIEYFLRQLEIRSVERGICPISTVFIAVTFQHFTLLLHAAWPQGLGVSGDKISRRWV